MFVDEIIVIMAIIIIIIMVLLTTPTTTTTTTMVASTYKLIKISDERDRILLLLWVYENGSYN